MEDRVRVTVKRCFGVDEVRGFSFIVPSLMAFDDDESAAWAAFTRSIRNRFGIDSSDRIILVDAESNAQLDSIVHIVDTQQLLLSVIEGDEQDQEQEEDEDEEQEENEEEEEKYDEKDEEVLIDEMSASSTMSLFPVQFKSRKHRLRFESFIEEATLKAPYKVVVQDQTALLCSVSTPLFALRLPASILPNPQMPLLSDLETELRCRSWMVVLCHGGCFSGAFFRNGKLCPSTHKTLRRYVSRQKQGRRQVNQDSSGGRSGGGHSSVGSNIRRSQEKRLGEEIEALLRSWKTEINSADLLFLHCPGQNRASLFFEGSPLDPSDARIRRVPFTTSRPTLTEVRRVVQCLSRVQIVTVDPSE